MAVIIPKMDIPESCADCELITGIITNGYGSFGRCSLIFGSWINILAYERRDDCPLKSADGLVEKIEDAIYAANSDEESIKEMAITIIKEYCK